MVDNYEAWLVDVVTNENSLADTIIWAASRDEAIAKAEEWAQAKCQEVMSLLIDKRPGGPGSIHSKLFDPFNL